MALQIKTIADNIAALTVVGVTFYPLTQLDEWELTGPTFFPDPIDFITNFQPTVDSFGTNATAKMHVEYDLNFSFAYEQVGQEYGLWAIYDSMVTLFGQIMDVLLTTDVVGEVYMSVRGISQFGVIVIPNNTQWHGCKIALHFMEFVN